MAKPAATNFIREHLHGGAENLNCNRSIICRVNGHGTILKVRIPHSAEKSLDKVVIL